MGLARPQTDFISINQSNLVEHNLILISQLTKVKGSNQPAIQGIYSTLMAIGTRQMFDQLVLVDATETQASSSRRIPSCLGAKWTDYL